MPMATRNLTKKYIDLRNGAKATRSLDLRKDSGSDDGEMVGIPAAKFSKCNSFVGSQNAR